MGGGRPKKPRGKGRGKAKRPVADPEALFGGALAHFEAGRLDDAEAALVRLDRSHPGIADVQQLRGMVALGKGDAVRAATILRGGLEADPHSAALADLLGTALAEAGDPAGAEVAYRRALNLVPGDPGVLNNLGNVFKKSGRLAESRDAYQESLARRPGHADTERNLGAVLEQMSDYAGAAEAYRRLVRVRPDDADALAGLGRMLLALGEFGDAEETVSRALALDPDCAEANEAFGIVCFLTGRLDEAWNAYEWRWRKEADRRTDLTQPLWSGQPVRGKTLFVWGEQGVGDEILFAGMVPDLLDAGARLVIECDERIVPLFRRSFAGIECVGRKAGAVSPPPPAGIDFHIPIGSLGRWLRPDFASFPQRPSYLAADNAAAARFREKYRDAGPGPVVGVAWRSENPRIGSDKSMPLMALRPLADARPATFVDLQYGDTADERRAFEDETGLALIHDTSFDQIKDLDAFAAQVAAMDLVISISNTTVHVAGALGVPSWIMLPVRPMWRWMADRADSPWYPSVRLFRQRRQGQWSDVVDRVARALADFGDG